MEDGEYMMKDKLKKINSQKVDWYDWILGAIGIIGFWFWSRRTDSIFNILFVLYMLIKYTIKASRKK